MKPDVAMAMILATDGLFQDGASHKQWYLERILEALGIDLVELRKEMNKKDLDWEKGIAP